MGVAGAACQGYRIAVSGPRQIAPAILPYGLCGSDRPYRLWLEIHWRLKYEFHVKPSN